MSVPNLPCKSVIYLALAPIAYGTSICWTAGILPSNFTRNANSPFVRSLSQLGCGTVCEKRLSSCRSPTEPSKATPGRQCWRCWWCGCWHSCCTDLPLSAGSTFQARASSPPGNAMLSSSTTGISSWQPPRWSFSPLSSAWCFSTWAFTWTYRDAPKCAWMFSTKCTTSPSLKRLKGAQKQSYLWNVVSGSRRSQLKPSTSLRAKLKQQPPLPAWMPKTCWQQARRAPENPSVATKRGVKIQPPLCAQRNGWRSCPRAQLNASGSLETRKWPNPWQSSWAFLGFAGHRTLSWWSSVLAATASASLSSGTRLLFGFCGSTRLSTQSCTLSATPASEGLLLNSFVPRSWRFSLTMPFRTTESEASPVWAWEKPWFTSAVLVWECSLFPWKNPGAVVWGSWGRQKRALH